MEFRGIKIKVLNIKTSQWDGFGITVLDIQWIFKGKVCIVSNSRSLFFFNFSIDYSKGGKTIRFRAGIFFIYRELWSKVIVPEKDDCEICGDRCETKDFYKNNVPLCEDCTDFK